MTVVALVGKKAPWAGGPRVLSLSLARGVLGAASITLYFLAIGEWMCGGALVHGSGAPGHQGQAWPGHGR